LNSAIDSATEDRHTTSSKTVAMYAARGGGIVSTKYQTVNNSFKFNKLNYCTVI